MALRYLLLLLLSVSMPKAHSHAYMDFGIEDVWLDKKCHLNVAIKNLGGALPTHFYFADQPTIINIKKGEQAEQSLSFSKLDRRRLLASDNGELVIKSKTVFVNNATPVTVELKYGEEFGDFNQHNDSATRAMDCRIGKGQIAGDAIVYTAPDVAIDQISIDAQSCFLNIDLSNKTGIVLQNNAWDEKNGVAIVIKNNDTGDIRLAIPLLSLDPKKEFTLATQTLRWRSDIAITQMQHANVAVWYVVGDGDFSNNERIIDVPEKCASQE
ncbi:MAG: hypothetical protein U5M23_11080 [Marinagarivorans sp.]|nr:hypothetical protein [Marinagarivorans sp.]